MIFVGIMHDYTALVSLLLRVAVMHHAYTLGVYQYQSVNIILECSTGELLFRAVFVPNDDKCHRMWKSYAALKPLRMA